MKMRLPRPTVEQLRAENTARCRKWREKNRTVISPDGGRKSAANARAYYRRNSDCILEKKRNPEARERRRAYSKVWRSLNPEKGRFYSGKYKVKIRNLTHPDHDLAEERKIVFECIRLTDETGVKHDVDHIIPLASGGWHHHKNLQPLPKSINATKGNNPIWESVGYKSWRDVPAGLWPEKMKWVYAALSAARP